MFVDSAAPTAFAIASVECTFAVEQLEFAAAEPIAFRFAALRFAAADYASRCSTSWDLAPVGTGW